MHLLVSVLTHNIPLNMDIHVSLSVFWYSPFLNQKFFHIFPELSNIVGIQQQNNNANPINGLNFHQTFTTPQFGFQQQGSLFNQQGHYQVPIPSTFHHNPSFQISSFLMPFFNNNKPNQNQQQPFPSFGQPGLEQGTDQPIPYPETGPQTPAIEEQPIISTTTTSHNYFPNFPVETSSTSEASAGLPTTLDPTLGFDIRLEGDKDVDDENSTLKIETASRRPIEGLPTSDEENTEEGVLDEKIGPQVVKSLVG